MGFAAVGTAHARDIIRVDGRGGGAVAVGVVVCVDVVIEVEGEGEGGGVGEGGGWHCWGGRSMWKLVGDLCVDCGGWMLGDVQGGMGWGSFRLGCGCALGGGVEGHEGGGMDACGCNGSGRPKRLRGEDGKGRESGVEKYM